MKRIARALVIGSISVGLAAGAALPASAGNLCTAYWGIPKACQQM